MIKKIEKIYYSWDDFDKDCGNLMDSITAIDGVKPSSIYGVPRGGLVVGTYLSHLLEIPLILDQARINSRTLIVDDISDSGKTLKKLLKDKKYWGVATLWMDTKTNCSPNITMNCKTKNQWIVFPWETITSSKYDKTL